LTNEFDNLSDGALKELTDTQLKSLDAQLKILDSTWESFLIHLDNGTGTLAKITRAFIGFTTSITKGLDNLAKGEKILMEELISKRALARFEEISDLLINKFTTQATKVERFGIEITTASQKIEDYRVRLSPLITEQLRLEEAVVKSTTGVDKTGGAFRRASKELEEHNKKIFGLQGQIKIETELIELLNASLEDNIDVTEDVKDQDEDGIKTKRVLVGLIELQRKVISDLNTEIQRSTTEDDIFNLKQKVDIAEIELKRLLRIVSSTREEFNKRSISLIEDDIDRTIAAENLKSEKVMEAIRSNSETSITEKQELIALEHKRLDKFERKQELKRENARIKRDADFTKASIDQKRTGFKTEEDFEKFKAEQLRALEGNVIDEKIAALEEFGDKESDLKIAQLKADKEALFLFEKAVEKNNELIRNSIQLTENIVINSLNKRAKLSREEEEAHKSSLEEFKNAAREGNIVAEESLAEEQRLAEQAIVEQQKIEKRKQDVLLVTAVLQAFNSELESGKSTGEALTSAISSTTVLSQFAAALPGFIDGTENVADSLGSPQLSGPDGHIIRVDGRERIMNPEQNAMIGNFSNDEVARTMEQKRLGNLTNDTQLIAMANGVDMSGMEAKLVSIEKAIVEKPEQNIEIGAITQKSFEILESTRRGNRTINNRFKVNHGS